MGFAAFPSREPIMSIAFRSNVFDENGSASLAKGDAKPRFKLAPTFVIDLGFSAAYLYAVLPNWVDSPRYGAPALPTFLVAGLLGLCYVGKILVVRHLDRRGGDARAYVKSDELVADGPFAYSRHPTYALAMLQFLLWSALALYLQAYEPWRPLMLSAALLLPAAFFLLNDWVVMPSEEAMLGEMHPNAYEGYKRQVNRWFGRRQAL